MKTSTILLLSFPSAEAFSALSSFARRTESLAKVSVVTRSSAAVGITMYDSSRDPPSSPELNSWHVLATTERWISATLADQNSSSSSRSSSSPSMQQQSPYSSNPYSRKEVAYACEPFSDAAMIVASIFRRLKEVREIGEGHAKQQRLLMDECNDDSYDPKTLRQTQVVVVPGNLQFRKSFATFDDVVRTINEARRQARDFVLTRSNIDDDDDDSKQWSVSINCAHMHPNFGQLTKQQELEQLQNEPDEVDLHYQEYQEKKMLARRSPYPTIVLEVRAIPPMNLSDGRSPYSPKALQSQPRSGSVSSSDIAALEALFGKSAHLGDSNNSNHYEEDAFYNAIGQTLEQVDAKTPLRIAQEWMVQHDDVAINKAKQVAFTESATNEIDAAYEFLFTNVAMMRDNGTSRQYLVYPQLLVSSATSLEKFCQAALNIMKVLPELSGGKMLLEIFHPEHVDASKRSPMPIVALELTD
ncbi:hypothetical protein MPSEU_000547900 [Mayamaea pseudoterrestris]|nr:hypothetical protein MPSEU_000547900 [Mayamaea pseudoterrestris]